MADNVSNFDIAVSTYQESCDRSNFPFQPPVEEYSKRINDVVYLRVSATGYVARYDIWRRQMLV